MTVASHKRVRVVSACDVTVPASAVPPPADLATDCGANIDAGSDGAGSATDDRGDDFPGAWSGTDSVLDLAQPLSAPDALRRIRSHALLFGTCHGTPALSVEAALGQQAALTAGQDEDDLATHTAATDPGHVWAFLHEQRLADMVTCSVSEETATSWELWAFAEFNVQLAAHFDRLEDLGLRPVASWACAPFDDVAAALAASLPPSTPAGRLISALLARPFAACGLLEAVRYRFVCPPFLHAWAVRYGIHPTIGGSLLAVTAIDTVTDQSATLYVPLIAALSDATKGLHVKLRTVATEQRNRDLVASLEGALVTPLTQCGLQMQPGQQQPGPGGVVVDSPPHRRSPFADAGESESEDTCHGGNAFKRLSQSGAAGGGGETGAQPAEQMEDVALMCTA